MSRRRVLALRVPADPRQPCAAVEVALSGAAFSSQIGGGLLDEAHLDVVPGGGYTVYADADRRSASGPGMTPNERAVALAARLGWIDLVDRVGLLGDVLLVGLDERGDDTDLPAARRAGLIHVLPTFCRPPHCVAGGRDV